MTSMWINAAGVSKILEVSTPSAYKVIRDIKAIQEKRGLFVNPNGKVPVKLFAECYGFDEDVVRAILEGKEPAMSR